MTKDLSLTNQKPKQIEEDSQANEGKRPSKWEKALREAIKKRRHPCSSQEKVVPSRHLITGVDMDLTAGWGAR